MKVISMLVLALTLATAPVSAQTALRTPEAIAADIAALGKNLDALAAELKVALSETRVADGGDLQAALNSGGVIRLTAGATYAGTYTLKSNTTLIGNGAKLTGSATGPALDIPSGTNDLYVSDLTLGTTWDQSVIHVGRNDSSQNTVALAPARITFNHISIPTYRGKRGIEINGADVKVLSSVLNDIFDNPTTTRDSQAIAILNAPGPVLVDGNDLSAGSENILVGGDTMKIPGVIPTGLTFTNNRFWKPLSWKTDGVNHAVKNLLELKTGKNVLVRHNSFDGCWVQAQDGYAIVVTPRSGGDIHDVLIEDNTITNVSSGFNILGRDGGTAPPTPSPLSNLVIRNIRLTTQSKTLGGRGVLALITGAPNDVTFDNVTAINDGNSILQLDAPKILNPDGTLAGYKKMAFLTLTNSRAVGGNYGLFFTGNVGGKNWQLFMDAFTFTGNTVVDPTSSDARNAMHSLYPNNTYVDRPTFDALLAAL